MKWVWAFEHDDFDFDHVDTLECGECGTHVGISSDGGEDSYGRLQSLFRPYAHITGPGITDDKIVASVRCEDCADMHFITCVRRDIFTCDRGAMRGPNKSIAQCDCCHGHGVHAVFETVPPVTMVMTRRDPIG